jgi:hypothetical protein
MWEKLQPILKKWWVWVLLILLIVSISFTIYEWQTTPIDLFKLIIAAAVGLVSFMSGLIKILKELSSKESQTNPKKAETLNKNHTEINQSGDQNNVLVNPSFHDPVIFDQHKEN